MALRDAAIVGLRAAAEELGRAPSTAWWSSEKRRPTYAQIVRVIPGGWSGALRAAGLPESPDNRGARASNHGSANERYSREDVIDALREAERELGQAPKSNWWQAQSRKPTYNVIVRIFEGGWRQALAAAGMAPNDPVIEGARGRGVTDAAVRIELDPPPFEQRGRRREPETPPFTDARISGRVTNALRRSGLHSLEAVAGLSREQLEAIPNLGSQSIAEIEDALHRRGLALQPSVESPNEQPVVPTHVTDLRLNEVDLSVRAYNALIRQGLWTLESVARLTSGHLLAMPNLGLTSLADIERVLANHGLTLGMTVASIDASGPIPPTSSNEVGEVPPTLHQVATADLLSLRTQQVLLLHGITTLEQLARYSEDDAVALRGVGPEATLAMRAALESAGLAFVSRDEREIPADARLQSSLSTANERAIRILEMRDEGQTLEQIGMAFGITRERVRQILKRHGGLGAVAVRQRREQVAREAASVVETSIIQRYRSGESGQEIASALDLTGSAVAEVVRNATTHDDRVVRRASRVSGRGALHTYSELDLIDAVREVGDQLGRTPSSGEYARAAAEFGLPSLPTVANRMGSWSAAVRAAGMTPLPANRQTYARRWTAETCWHALRALVREIGEVPAVQAYEVLAIGDPQLPSLATIRHRLGRWSTVAARLADLPSADEILIRLGLQGVASEDRQETIWLAYLGEELSLDELEELAAVGAFGWDASFGSIPEQLRSYLR